MNLDRYFRHTVIGKGTILFLICALISVQLARLTALLTSVPGLFWVLGWMLVMFLLLKPGRTLSIELKGFSVIVRIPQVHFMEFSTPADEQAPGSGVNKS